MKTQTAFLVFTLCVTIGAAVLPVDCQDASRSDIAAQPPLPAQEKEASTDRLSLALDPLARGSALTDEEIEAIAKILPKLTPLLETYARSYPESLEFFVRRGSKEENLEDVARLLGRLQELSSDRPRLPSNVAYRAYTVEKPIEEEMARDFSLNLAKSGDYPYRGLIDLCSRYAYVENFESRCETRDSEHTTLIQVTGEVSSIDHLKELIKEIERGAEGPLEVEYLSVVDPAGRTFARGQRMPLSDLSGQTEEQTRVFDKVKKTLQGILGDPLVVTGTWFGDSALPGRCTAPIGPWRLEISSSLSAAGEQIDPFGEEWRRSDRRIWPSEQSEMLLLYIRLSDGKEEILTNTVAAHIDRPIIVGYSRLQNDVHISGALVVIPEEVLGSPETSEKEKRGF